MSGEVELQPLQLGWERFYAEIVDFTKRLSVKYGDKSKSGVPYSIYGVPRGGYIVAYALSQEWYRQTHTPMYITHDPIHADMIVDDICDSGATQKRYTEHYPDAVFEPLLYKKKLISDWVVFPWEHKSPFEGTQESAEDNIRRLLQVIGEDPNREGLLETPKRVIKAWKEMCSGYNQKPEDILTVFEDGACDEMVLLKGIEFQSSCEHHMLPFTGKAHIAYIPDKKIIGISKLARLLDIYAKRLQVQERLTVQITDALEEMLHPLGAACVIEASHECMRCRGVGKQNATMVTSSLTGGFKERNSQTRAELFSLIGQ